MNKFDKLKDQLNYYLKPLFVFIHIIKIGVFVPEYRWTYGKYTLWIICLTKNNNPLDRLWVGESAKYDYKSHAILYSHTIHLKAKTRKEAKIEFENRYLEGWG